MNATGKKPRRSRTSPSKTKKKDRETDSQSMRIVLTQAEKELLLKACTKYRYTIPAYLQSRQAEVDTLNAIVSKLS